MIKEFLASISASVCDPRAKNKNEEVDKFSAHRTDRMIQHEGDFAARLRAPFQGEDTQAVLQREDVLGAADEIELLWSVIWSLVGSTNDITRSSVAACSVCELTARHNVTRHFSAPPNRSDITLIKEPIRPNLTNGVSTPVPGTSSPLRQKLAAEILRIANIMDRFKMMFTLSSLAYCTVHLLFLHKFSLYMFSEALVFGTAAATAAGGSVAISGHR